MPDNYRTPDKLATQSEHRKSRGISNALRRALEGSYVVHVGEEYYVYAKPKPAKKLRMALAGDGARDPGICDRQETMMLAQGGEPVTLQVFTLPKGLGKNIVRGIKDGQIPAMACAEAATTQFADCAAAAAFSAHRHGAAR